MSEPALFDLLESKMNWISARQHVVAQNISNADTPGYRPKDMAPFSALLDQFNVTPAQTNPLHLAGYAPSGAAHQQTVTEHSPDGNAVGLENQLTKVADNENMQAMTGNLWKTYMGMFMTALGHG